MRRHQAKIQVVRHENRPTKPYQILRSLSGSHWCFWHGLPTLTNLRIWLYTYRVWPLPIITTAVKGLGIDLSVAGIVHQVAGWASVAGVMYC